MRYIPIGDRVLVKKDKPTKEINGIILADIAVTETNYGEVIELGTGYLDNNGKKIDWKIKVGDKIIIEPSLDNIRVTLEQDNYVIVRQDEIIGVIEK